MLTSRSPRLAVLLAAGLAAAGCHGVTYPHTKHFVAADSGPPAAPPLFAPPSSLPQEVTPLLDGSADPFTLEGVPPQMAISELPGSALQVSGMDHEQAWEQIVDVVNDYFRVENEEQVHIAGGVLTRGRIDTFPQIGATILEPHRPDSVGRFNRWESTLQTIRRRAVVHVIPQGATYEVQIAVEKELEDLPRPLLATAGSVSFRHDDSLPSRRKRPVTRTRLSSRWIPLGRDVALEQAILSDIQQRFQEPRVAKVYNLPTAQ